jgi:hypothetical protein
MSVFGLWLLVISEIAAGFSGSHVSARSNEWEKNSKKETLSWPLQSSVLTIKENVWKVLKVLAQRRANEIRNA